MKKVIICCSISAANRVLEVREELEHLGYEVEIPLGVQQYIDNGYQHLSKNERAKDKREMDLINRYYKKISDSDIVLVVNEEKDGIKNYIGGNTFLEMGFAHVLQKPLFVLNSLPNSLYRDELEALNLEVINGDLSLIR